MTNFSNKITRSKIFIKLTLNHIVEEISLPISKRMIIHRQSKMNKQLDILLDGYSYDAN